MSTVTKSCAPFGSAVSLASRARRAAEKAAECRSMSTTSVGPHRSARAILSVSLPVRAPSNLGARACCSPMAQPRAR
ncbi:unnamed protein product [Symbiodinium sp. KB8]|nr:unnamed protein product [Symbiodinium sp. KB8]